MKNDFFTSLKDGFADNIADINYCKQLVDNYVTSLDCAGASCRGMNEIKKGFAYIVSKYKSLLKLKNQNEEIFSQILHDIKSPLLGVKYALEDKKRSELDDEIYKINLNALDLIGDFLLLYSFRDGYKKLNFYNFSPSKVVEEQINIYEPLSRQKKLKIRFEKEYEGEIFSNKQIFSRIVSNLISNALKYSSVESGADFKLHSDGKNVIFETKNAANYTPGNDKGSYGLGQFIIKRLLMRINGVFCRRKTVHNQVVYEIKIPKCPKAARQGRLP